MGIEEETEILVKKIIRDIHLPKFYYLIEATNNHFTSGLYEIDGSLSSYHKSTVEIFEKYSEDIRSLLKGKGIILIYVDSGHPIIRVFPHYNKELHWMKTFDLLLHQEFGIQPHNERNKLHLEESLKKEKIKSTLVYACYLNDTDEILNKLKKASVAQLKKQFCSTTPLGFCTQHDNLTVFQEIIGAGADLGKLTVLKKSALEYAFAHSPSIVKYIYKNHYGQFVKEISKLGFSIAYHTKDPSLLQLVLECGANLDCPRTPFPPLHCFADYNNLVGIEFLLKNGADITTLNKLKETALDRAKKWNNSEAIQVLKKYAT